ncbi:MAG TPA: malonyl-ACP O-methyltransferase BioC [Gammaproteobacteria bacterium]|nr:malonyl-ACP O-methyltransferase BioC [Gammaproteobacteria bacterium]
MSQLVLPAKNRTYRAFQRAAATYDAAAVLQQEVGRRLLERLDVIRIEPTRVLDVGAGTGEASGALLRRYPRAQVLALDLAPAMLQHARRRGRLWRRPLCISADAEALPLLPASVDLIVSNLALPWVTDLDRTFASFIRALRPGGLLLFSSFGPDTLIELRQAWAAADDHVHVHDFIDMHDVGDALMRAGFADPVMEAEHITLTYPDLDALVRDLRATGGRNIASGRRTGLTPPRAAAAMRAAYEHWRQPDGRLPASSEVIYGHAWAPQTLPQRRVDGTVGVPLSSIGRRGQG